MFNPEITRSLNVAEIREDICADLCIAFPFGRLEILPSEKQTVLIAENRSIVGTLRFTVGIAVWDLRLDGTPNQYWKIEKIGDRATAVNVGTGYSLKQALDSLEADMRIADQVWVDSLTAV